MIIDRKYKAVCFDMDNTLLKTELDYGVLRTSIPRTVMGLGVDPGMIRAEGMEFVRQVSLQLERQGKAMSAEDVLQRIKDDMLAVEMSTAEKSRSFPGTAELLTGLERQGFRLGMLTNGFRKYVEYNLGKFDLARHFETIVTYDDLEYGQQKPDPAAMRYLAGRMCLEPEAILYLGDSIGDYQSAKGAGAGFVAVCTGSMTEDQWKSIDGDMVVIPCITDLLDRGSAEADGASDPYRRGQMACPADPPGCWGIWIYPLTVTASWMANPSDSDSYENNKRYEGGYRIHRISPHRVHPSA